MFFILENWFETLFFYFILTKKFTVWTLIINFKIREKRLWPMKLSDMSEQLHAKAVLSDMITCDLLREVNLDVSLTWKTETTPSSSSHLPRLFFHFFLIHLHHDSPQRQLTLIVRLTTLLAFYLTLEPTKCKLCHQLLLTTCLVCTNKTSIRFIGCTE